MSDDAIFCNVYNRLRIARKARRSNASTPRGDFRLKPARAYRAPKANPSVRFLRHRMLGDGGLRRRTRSVPVRQTNLMRFSSARTMRFLSIGIVQSRRRGRLQVVPRRSVHF
eukprot:scaffold111638_cov33-Tisochrysis_lutea.AAC.2